jgi:hypothetical protein
MISQPTALVLGAGASVHVGYPLGSELLDDICARRGSVFTDEWPTGWAVDQIAPSLLRMCRSEFHSIDAFLDANTEQADVGRFLIARELKSRERMGELFRGVGAWLLI